MQEVWFSPWVRKIPWREGMSTHSNILAWEIPWTEESGRVQSMGLQRVGHDWVTNTFTFHWIKNSIDLIYSRILHTGYTIKFSHHTYNDVKRLFLDWSRLLLTPHLPTSPIFAASSRPPCWFSNKPSSSPPWDCSRCSSFAKVFSFQRLSRPILAFHTCLSQISTPTPPFKNSTTLATKLYYFITSYMFWYEIWY